MSDESAWVEIVLLAMLAAFIGLRLVSVLGKRAGEERPQQIGDSFRPSAEVTAPPRRTENRGPRGRMLLPPGTDASLLPALEAIGDADPAFAPDHFLTGARAAYGMILSAFWAGDLSGVVGLVSDEVHENLAGAIAGRDGASLPNRILGTPAAVIEGAEQVGQMVELTVRFAARIATGEGDIESRDVWTFSRHVTSSDPAWVLIATDNEDDSSALPPDHDA